MVTNGEFNHEGTTSGNAPVVVTGNDADPGRLNLAGDGAGRFQLEGRTQLDGDISEDQTVTVLAFEGQAADATRADVGAGGLTNDGTLILDCSDPGGSCETATADIVAFSGPLTNNGTLSTGAPGGGARIFGSVVSSGTVTIGDTFGLFGFSPWQQTGGTTTITGLLDVTPNEYQLIGGTLAGTGTLNGAVTNSGGTVSPGASPGLLTFQTGYTQGAGGTLAIEVNGAGAGQFDQLAVDGDVTLGGTLALLPSAGFDAGPVVGAKVPFLNYDGEPYGNVRHDDGHAAAQRREDVRAGLRRRPDARQRGGRRPGRRRGRARRRPGHVPDRGGEHRERVPGAADAGPGPWPRSRSESDPAAAPGRRR